MHVFASRTALALMALLHAGATAAQTASSYPSRTVTLIVPFSAGTGMDAVARAIAPRLSQRWGQAVVVDNRPGASGNIGAEAVARSAPNGHTLMVTAGTITITPALFKNVPYDVVADFAPVAKLGIAGYAFTVNPAVMPANDLNALLATVKSNPGKFHYSSPGNGTPHHLGMELLKLRLGLDIPHVPYKGLAGALTDLLGGQVQMIFTLVPSAIPHVRAGRLKVLAVTGTTRTALMPDAPTFREQGIAFMDQLDAWYGLLAPARTPPDIIARLNAEVRTVLALPEVRDQLMKQGIEPAPGTTEEFTALIRDELVRWAALVRDAKIVVD